MKFRRGLRNFFEITPRRVFPVGNLPCLSLGDPCANARIWLLATQSLKPSYEWDYVIIRLNPADTPQLTSTWKGPRRVSCFWVQSSFQVSLVLMRCPLLLVSVITLLNIWLYYQGKMIWHTFVYTTVKIWYIFTIEGLKNVHVIPYRTNCKCSLKYFRPQF